MSLKEYLELAFEQLYKKGTLYLSIWVKTGAPFTRWRDLLAQTGPDGGVDYHLKLDVRALPEKGKANTEIYRFLADEFNLRKDDVSIISGIVDNRKVVMLKAEIDKGNVY